jgi:ferredoxin
MSCHEAWSADQRLIRIAEDSAAVANGENADTATRSSSRRTETDMKIVVDYDLCESNARCMEVAPELFEVRDDDQLYVLDENPPESARERVLRAIKVCPKHAISLVEQK